MTIIMMVIKIVIMLMLMMISLDSYPYSSLKYRGSPDDPLNYLEELNGQVLEAIVR